MVEQVEDLLSWFHEQPERIVNLGSSCLTIGFILFGFGMWGMIAITAMNAMNHLAKQPQDATLASTYPNYPTWWIPESILGILVMLVLFMYGVFLVYQGKKIKRIMNY